MPGAFGKKKAHTIEEAREKLEETFDHTANLSDEELVEIEKLYRLSAPIRIPVAKLDANYEYRWVNRNRKVFRRRRGIGWTPVTDVELEKLAKVDVDDLHMGTHIDPGSNYVCTGDDLILCKIPKRVAEALRKARLRENRARMAVGKRLFHETGELAGVKTFERGE